MQKHLFNKGQTATLRGIVTLIVMLHHFSGKVSYSYILYPFSIGGYSAVALFLLLSGFGSYKSWERNRDPNGVLWRRGSQILIPWGLLLLAYGAVFLVSGEFDMLDFMKHCFTVSLPNHVLWYPKVQLMLYGVFFLVYYRAGFGVSAKQNIFFLFCILYIALLICLGTEQYWYMTTIFYPIGIWLGKHIDEIEERLRKLGLVLVGVSGCFFALLFAYQFFYGNAGFGSILDFAYAFSFCVFLFCCSLRFEFRCRGLECIGSHSFELYLMHLAVLDIGTQLNIYQKLHLPSLTIIFVIVSLVFAYALGYVKRIVISHMDSLLINK